MTPALYDGRDVADRIGFPYEDVMSWSRRGIIPRIKTGKRVVFNLDRVVESLYRPTGVARASTAGPRM